MKFKTGGNVKILLKERYSKRGRKISGTIYAITEDYIVVQREKYKECVLLTDFMTGEAQVI